MLLTLWSLLAGYTLAIAKLRHYEVTYYRGDYSGYIPDLGGPFWFLFLFPIGALAAVAVDEFCGWTPTYTQGLVSATVASLFPFQLFFSRKTR